MHVWPHAENEPHDFKPTGRQFSVSGTSESFRELRCDRCLQIAWELTPYGHPTGTLVNMELKSPPLIPRDYPDDVFALIRNRRPDFKWWRVGHVSDAAVSPYAHAQ